MSANEEGLLLVVSGPSGAGKTTVLSELLRRRSDLYFSVSSTTRTPREGERDGVSYHFVGLQDFQTDLAAGRFIEWAEYAGNLYGTPLRPLLDAKRAGKVVVLDIEVRGALQVRERCPDAVLVYMWPGSFDELERRLRGRGTEQEQMLRMRLAIAMEEYKSLPEYKYRVINHTVEAACNALEAIITAERCLIRRRPCILDADGRFPHGAG